MPPAGGVMKLTLNMTFWLLLGLWVTVYLLTCDVTGFNHLPTT